MPVSSMKAMNGCLVIIGSGINKTQSTAACLQNDMAVDVIKIDHRTSW